MTALRVLLMALLLAAFLPGCGPAAALRRSGRATATLEVVQRLDAALRAWRRERGTLPTGDAVEVARVLGNERTSAGEPFAILPATPHVRGGPYDAWDRPIRVRAPAARSDGPADVWSVGEDGVDEEGAGDDVSAWSGFDATPYARIANPVDAATAGFWGAVLVGVVAAGTLARVRRRTDSLLSAR